jgi:hypothetical protein
MNPILVHFKPCGCKVKYYGKDSVQISKCVEHRLKCNTTLFGVNASLVCGLPKNHRGSCSPNNCKKHAGTFKSCNPTCNKSARSESRSNDLLKAMKTIKEWYAPTASGGWVDHQDAITYQLACQAIAKAEGK